MPAGRSTLARYFTGRRAGPNALNTLEGPLGTHHRGDGMDSLRSKTGRTTDSKESAWRIMGLAVVHFSYFGNRRRVLNNLLPKTCT